MPFMLSLPPCVASGATYTGRTLHCSNALTTSACQWEEPVRSDTTADFTPEHQAGWAYIPFLDTVASLFFIAYTTQYVPFRFTETSFLKENVRFRLRNVVFLTPVASQFRVAVSPPSAQYQPPPRNPQAHTTICGRKFGIPSALPSTSCRQPN